MFNIVILDYCIGEVRVYHFPKRNEPRDVEAWIKKHDKNWKDSQCYYMSGDNIQLCHMDRDTGERLIEESI